MLKGVKHVIHNNIKISDISKTKIDELRKEYAKL